MDGPADISLHPSPHRPEPHLSPFPPPTHLEQREHLQEVINGPPAVHVRLPVPQRLGQLLGLRLVLVHGLAHLADLLDDVDPEVVSVALDGGDDGDVQVVQPVQHLDLLLRLLQLRVEGHGQAEQLLTGGVVLPLALAHLKGGEGVGAKAEEWRRGCTGRAGSETSLKYCEISQQTAPEDTQSIHSTPALHLPSPPWPPSPRTSAGTCAAGPLRPWGPGRAPWVPAPPTPCGSAARQQQTP